MPSPALPSSDPAASDLPPHADDSSPLAPANGKTSFELKDLLHALQAVRTGDFSVRLAGDHLGIEGKIADTFNEIVGANERMAKQLERVGQVVGREGKTRQRVRFGLAERRLGRNGDVDQFADRRSAVADA